MFRRLAIFTHYSLHWVVAFSFFFLYVGIMLFAHVPTWTWTSPGHFDNDNQQCLNRTTAKLGLVRQCTAKWVPEVSITTICDTHGDLTPKCSATRMVDEWLLGFEHMYSSGEFTRRCGVAAFCVVPFEQPAWLTCVRIILLPAATGAPRARRWATGATARS
jgi:hypothetical protein